MVLAPCIAGILKHPKLYTHYCYWYFSNHLQTTHTVNSPLQWPPQHSLLFFRVQQNSHKIIVERGYRNGHFTVCFFLWANPMSSCTKIAHFALAAGHKFWPKSPYLNKIPNYWKKSWDCMIWRLGGGQLHQTFNDFKRYTSSQITHHWQVCACIYLFAYVMLLKKIRIS